MFLYQKLNYKVIKLEQPTLLPFQKDDIVAFDTETTGLNVIVDKPFLFVAGANDTVYYWLDASYCKDYSFKAYAHNAKYDWHIMKNIGIEMPNLIDSKVIARLSSYADDEDGMSLEVLGQKYVDENAKFASKVISKKINDLNKERLKIAKKKVKEEFPDVKITKIFEEYRKRVQFVETEYDDIFDFIDLIYRYPNYKDVYEDSPDLMISYAIDDVVILLEYLKKALLVVNEYYQDTSLLEQEQKLVSVVGEMEREGFNVDVKYLLESRLVLQNYKNKLYQDLYEITKKEFSVNQHKVIMEFLNDKYNTYMPNCDMDALESVANKTENSEVKLIVEYIIELRTLEKWISTYVDGMLNRIVNGKIHPSIDNAGTVTGRVSSDFQQQPKEALLDRNGNELFHPRKAFINKPNQKMYFFDYSQMEMRVQAHYTLLLGEGDTNLCRAFMPFKCQSLLDSCEFVYKRDNIDSGEWVDENDNIWSPIDLHTLTTLKAFPDIKESDEDFKHYRRLGKMCNFLKNYGGSYNALKRKLKIDDEIINALNQGYYKAYPKILEYQKWVSKQLLSYGYVENLYGRKYFISTTANYYKAYNYVVQGSCADFFKQKQIKIYDLLKDKKSKAIMVIHDEIVISIADDENYLVQEIKNILDDYTLQVPMISGVDYTQTNWADKEKIK